MDYNDNDYEGQNLHLAGEETSKISSVLRPFTLPKFDFDDSLHGHLRFDSLVENEVFLGISSQEDNQWIEDFSRGSSGIEFSSTATESCALPRRNNVWSEATSSESVEMLLKAVGQEEMVPEEIIIEESGTGEQPGSSIEHMETNLMQDKKIDDVDSVNPSLSPAEVEGDRLNQSAGVQDIHSDRTLQALEKKSSSYELCADDKDTSEKLNTDMKSTSDNQGETRGLVNDSMNEQVQENLRVIGMEIDNTERTSQEFVNAGESGIQGKVCDTSLVSSICISNDITEDFEDQKEGTVKIDEGLGAIAVETVTVNPEMHCSVEIPPEMESLTEEQTAETCMSNLSKSSSRPEKGEFLSSVDGSHVDASVIKPGSSSECGTVVFSPGTGIKQHAEECSILHERLSVSFQGEECVEDFGAVGSNTFTSTISSNIELKQVHVTEVLDQPKSPLCDEGICHGSISSLDASHSTSNSSLLPNVLSNHSEQDIGINIHHTDVPGNLVDSTIAGECGETKSVIEDMKDVRSVAIIHKEKLEDEDYAPPPLLAVSIETCGEDITFMQADVHEAGHDAFAYKKNDNELPLGLSKMVCDDNEKKVESSSPGEGVELNLGRATGSQFNTSAGDHQVLNTEAEDANATHPCVEGDESATHPEHDPPSLEVGYKDREQETETEATSEPRTSILKSIEVDAEVAPTKEDEKSTVLDSDSAGGTKAGDPSVSLMTTSSTALPHEACKELNEGIEHPASNLIVPNYDSEAAPTERPMAADLERSGGTNSPIVSISCSPVEFDKSDQLPVVSYTDLPESQISERENLSRNEAEIVGGVVSPSVISGVNALSKDEGTFTFDTSTLRGQSTADSDKSLQSFPRIQACKLSSTGEGSPSASRSIQKDQMIEKEVSQGSSLMPSAGPSPSGGVKGPSERKSRRGSSKSVKESAKKGSLVKETSPWHTERGDKPSLSFSPVGAAQLRTFESALKPRGTVPLPTSRLPDLNTSAPSSAFFQQPFTDLQQVQLRAQIFVYGSLIQGAAPDEACMVSAFDGDRSHWEPSWRACVEKYHAQKNQGNYSETPLQTRSGAKASGQTSRHGVSQSEVLSTPTGRTSSKPVASPVVNPNIPLSSPLWNISTPSCEGLPSSSLTRCAVFDYQAVASLNPYQTPPMQNFMAHSTSWPSQAPFPVPWSASSQSSPFDIGTRFSAFPMTEPVKLNPVKESPFSLSSGVKQISHVPAIHTGATTMFSGASSLGDLKKVTAPSGQTSGDTKTRKRKKSSGVEDVVLISAPGSVLNTGSSAAISNHMLKKLPAVQDSQSSLIARNRADPIPTLGIACHYSTSIAVTTPSSFVPRGTPNQFSSTVSPSISSDHHNKGDLNVDKRAQNLESSRKVEEAKSEAEEAAAQAAAAVSDCQGVWSQLNQQKNSGLTSDVEAKLASAAVAIAAAASVAKAAAAAAKIASSAAVVAKQMADEAMTNMVNVTPLSISKGSDSNTLAISAAREAAKKRVEAASAATRHAENLDAIVKAAELAAEAVSHTAKIVGVSDPFTLNELVKEGPDRYWKVSQVAGSKSNDSKKNKSIIGDGEVPNVFMNLHEGPDKDVPARDRVHPTQGEVPKNIVDAEQNQIASAKHVEKHLQPQKDKRVSDSRKSVGTVSEPDTQAGPDSTVLHSYEVTASIKEGSVIEVLKDQGDLKKAWFSAKVQSLKDGEVLVCYTELQSDEGSEQLKEWVSLEAQGDKPPAVRIPHPMTAVQFEGTRKRRRSAVKDYAWSVGDKVDAWVQDCWREGIIADKNDKDATTLNVHFPAQGEKLNVKVWHLRPTLIWNDGQWIEWCRSGQDGASQGDTPMEKRRRRGNTSTETKEKGNMSKNIEIPEVGTTEEPRLPLSANEKVFNIGTKRDETNPSLGRTMRSGLQKEGSRVVIGVPKPGKKRKFMKVSTHYDSDRSVKPAVPNDSVKLSKFLMPQGSGSRGPKYKSNLDFKDKQAPESKSRAPPKSWKPPSIPSRTLPKKDDSSSSRPASDAALSDNTAKGSMSNDDNESGEQNLTESGSFSNAEETSGGSFVFSSQAVVPDSRNKASTRNKKSERLNKGKLAPAFGRSARSESNEKLISEASEPRRSNRRIQPTSRLLEGLQSSLLVSKIPSSSHDKSQRNQSKGPSRGNNNRG